MKIFRVYCQTCGYNHCTDDVSTYTEVKRSPLFQGIGRPDKDLSPRYKCPGCGRLIAAIVMKEMKHEKDPTQKPTPFQRKMDNLLNDDL